MPHTPVMFTLDRAHRLRMRAWQTLPHSASGTSRAHDPPNCRKHRIPSQLNWQEVTLRALTITKASLRPSWKKEIKGPSEPQPPTPQLTSSPVSPDQTWSSGDSLPPYLSYVMPGDIWNKLVFSPRSKKKKSSPFWYMLRDIYIYIVANNVFKTIGEQGKLFTKRLNTFMRDEGLPPTLHYDSCDFMGCYS